MKRKPYNMKYTDLCIYIDNTVYNRDDHNNPISLREMSSMETENVYNYLYNLIYALAMKKKLLTKKADYEDFAIETAGNIFMRLTSKDQDFTMQNKTNKAIKSILNYLKGCLAFIAITWRNTYYAETLNPEYDSEDEIDAARKYAYSQASSQYEDKRKEAHEELFKDLPIYINKALAKSIFKNNKLKKYELEISQYLSLLNCMTLENKYKDTRENNRYNKIMNQLADRKNNIINYSEDPLITDNLIDLQLRKTFFMLEDEKNDIDKDLTPSDQDLDNILATSYNTYGMDQRGDH